MKKLLLLTLPFLIFFLNCDEENPVLPVGTVPELSQLTAPETLYLISQVQHFISVHVDDPQGRENIASVIVEVKLHEVDQIIRTYTLVDNGTKGDIIPLDGTYTTEIKADSSMTQAGKYVLLFKAIDLDGNESEYLTHELMILEGEENIAPIISDAMIPFSIFINDTDFYFISVKVKDPQGADNIDIVKLEIFEQTTLSPMYLDTLKDDGTDGDQQGNDGIYSTVLSPKFTNKKTGKYTFRIQAVDKAGAMSNPVAKIVDVTSDVIITENLPPFIYNLVAPDTMKLSNTATVTTVLKVSVTDREGLEDVRRVYFDSYLPDGRPSSGNPFIMADNGATTVNGDEIAGDGVYSLLIGLPPNTTTGNYTFIFEAVDKSDAMSNQITHVITVVQ